MKTWKELEETVFTPERKRDAAKMLRSWAGRGKTKALKYAEMLEREATCDERQSRAFRQEYEESRLRRPDYNADQ